MKQVVLVKTARSVLVAVAALAITVPAFSQSAPPVAGGDVVGAIRASIEQVRARQAALPPPKDDSERLLRLGELDQAPRRIIVSFDFGLVPSISASPRSPRPRR